MSGTGKDNSVVGQVAHGFNAYARAISGYDLENSKKQGTKDSIFGGIANLGGKDGSYSGFNSLSNLIGYNPANGKWGDKGSDADWLNEGLGQINGSNAARHAAGVAGDAVILAKQQADTLLSQTNEAKHQSDIQASSQAAGIRATATAAGAFNPSMTTPLAVGSGGKTSSPKLGSDQEDFLGL